MKLISLLLTMLFAIGCTAASPSAGPGDTPPGAMPVSEARAGAIASDAAAMTAEIPAAGSPAGEVDTRCARDADCEVKNVGNCCGYFPACVNTASPTFPEQVRLQCEKEGTMGICGFREISGCMCVEGRCAPADGVQ